MLRVFYNSIFLQDCPLKFWVRWVRLKEMTSSPARRTFPILMGVSFIVSMLLSSVGWAAPEFKIRYNSKFPCLEVMDGKANKITDISEGTKGEVVTSGKSSITLSFVKGSAGQPEVTMTDAKSALSEMELEAFGLSVGMKPAGVVTVRFGSDNKPQFEMDRTGGARFLMADLGNLDTAAGKELAAANATPTPEVPKGLLRFRERLKAWKASGGKGGWSNRPGKILSCGEDAKVTYSGQPERKLLDGEAIQAGAEVVAGASPVSFQSGPGIYHQLLAGSRAQIAALVTGQKDVKVTLLDGTLLTQIVEPLVAPRLHVCGIGNGVVIQSTDGVFQVSLAGTAGARLAVAQGSLRLVEEAGAAQVAEATAGTVLAWPSEKTGKKLSSGSPEIATLNKIQSDSRRDYLVDMAEDAIKSASAEAEEIIQATCSADPASARNVALNLLEIRPDLRDLIAKASGIADLPQGVRAGGEAEAFAKRVEPWLRAEPSPTSCVGRVLWLEGKASYADGLSVKRGMVLKQGETIQTGGDGRVILVASPGVIAEIQPGSAVKLVEMNSQFQSGKLVSSKAVLDASQGKALVSIASGLGDKVQAELRTPEGVTKGRSDSRKDVNL
jgi:hypothetical protein